jgi:phosphoribosylformylglycinamidine (FGAM) synthase PurS component
MQKSTIPFLLISFLLTITLNSCATLPTVGGYTSMPLTKTTYDASYFSNPAADYIYKANITAYGNELSGIFIAKKINETTHRVVFTTEFGNKLLDFEISENDFKVNAIVDELNRKILINTLKSDFRLLLRNHYVMQQQYENAKEVVYKAADSDEFNYLFVSKDGKLSKIVHTSKRKEKINLSFISENNIFADNIVIQHNNIKLRIELNYLKNQ